MRDDKGGETKKMNRMRQIAFFGKGGIGKSTIASNIAAALADKGFKVMMIGCDPKSDCTRNLRGDVEIPTISEVLREKVQAQLEIDEFIYGKEIKADEVVFEGYKGILCAEAGGPEPGVGCAGRGIVVAVDLLKRIGVFGEYKPDVVIYDILGDIVCGGFGMNLRQGMADQAIIVTSADYLAIYAANNICRGIARYADRGGTRLGGFIYNVRGALDDMELVKRFAEQTGSRIIGSIPSSNDIAESEIYGQTTVQRYPDSDMAEIFRNLADSLLEDHDTIRPKPLSSKELTSLAMSIREKAKRQFMKKGE